MRAAPWSGSVKAASVLAVVILGALALGLPHALSQASHPAHSEGVQRLLSWLPLAIVAVATLFVVRGYEIDGTALLVQRLFWSTRVPIDGLQRAWQDPDAMARSIRIFGNSGLFSVTGIYRNKALGTYRAFVTDRKRAVVLRTAKRTIVVSPERPEALLAALKMRFPLSDTIGAPRS